MQNPDDQHAQRSEPVQVGGHAIRVAPQPRTDETIKETFESIIIAFILAFVFRAYVVEAFVIPTGSMAPTLLGEHLTVACPQCGYRFTSDVPEPMRQQQFLRRQGGQTYRDVVLRPHVTQPLKLVCPMCHFPVPVQEGSRLRPGDRILVHKYIYSVFEPRRWDVVVFKNPQEPNTNFIKRLVGLPGEQLWIIEGNIYTRPLSGGDSDWQIARKTDRPVVQRSVWQPIYHSQYVPLDGGGRSLDRRGQGVDHLWRQPWTPTEAAAWQAGRDRFVYQGQGSGELRFDFEAALSGRHGIYAYNQLSLLVLDLEPVEDVRVAATVVPLGAAPSVTLNTTARLDLDVPHAPRLPLSARIDAVGLAELLTVDGSGQGTRVLAQAQVEPWQRGQPRRMELWYVDQDASLWLDGQRVLHWQFDLSLPTLRDRPPLPGLRESPPQVSVQVSGGPVELGQLELDRDLYYGSIEPRGYTLGRGALDKQSSIARGEPVTIQSDRFFCLGDNSHSSSDSRFWNSINPWIRLRLLDDDRQELGMVPRNLMMGRAFFVYYPAPHAWRPDLPAFFPNFGDMRFIH